MLALLLFCSCLAEEPAFENPKNGSEGVQNVEPGIFGAENGKFGIKDGSGAIITEPVYDSIKTYDFKKSWKYIGTMENQPGLQVEYDENGEPFVTEALGPRYYFIDESGCLAVDIAFEWYAVTDGADLLLAGAADGNFYEYAEKDGKLVLCTFEPAFEEEKEYGFVYTGYTYCGGGRPIQYRGMKKDGKVIIENVAESITVMDEDTLWVTEECSDGVRNRIADGNGNYICEKFEEYFSRELESGKKIAFGIVGRGYLDNLAPFFDEKGEPMESGFWIIDLRGEILSEKFDISLMQNGYRFEKDFMVFYENGEEVFRIDLDEYAI